MPTGKPFSLAEKEAMIAEYQSGKSLKEVAELFGASAPGVSLVLKRHGIPTRAISPRETPLISQAEFCKLYQDGESIQSIAADKGVNPKTVARALHKSGIKPRLGGPKKYNEELRAKFVTEYESGDSASLIASRHGVSNWTVFNVLRKLEITRAPGASLRTYPDEFIQEVVEAYKSGSSQDKVGKRFGLHQATVSRLLAMKGVETRKPKGLRGEKHWTWKGGITRTADGYVLVRTREFESMSRINGYIPEHRLVMARHLGRPLSPHETVHHRNGVRDDNRLENLELFVGSHPRGATQAHCSTCTCFAGGAS